MVNSPFVSICIPTYNGEKFLSECLDSCLAQTYEHYEIVVCDDGSTDATRAIIESYLKKNARLSLTVNEKNLGMVGNWNKCIDRAGGEWVKFVFQDDYIAPNCLERFVSAITPASKLLVSQRHFILPPDASSAQVKYYTEEVRTLRNTSSFSGIDYLPGQIAKTAADNICLNFIGEPSLTFFKKSLVMEVGAFEGALKQICDLEFALRISTHFGLTYIPEDLCFFRIHKDSATSTNIQDKFFELRYVEPVIFTWYLLFDARYVFFRSYLTRFQSIKLRVYFRVKVYLANRINLREHRNHPLFKNGTGFREIIENKNGNLFIKLISLLIR